MAFWTYHQNNSGGGFDYDPERGISCNVIVEAGSESEADERAERIGLYFDGAGDCQCCGNRWSGAWGSGDEVPSIYGIPVGLYYSPGACFRDSDQEINPWYWVDGYDTFVHYIDGSIAPFGPRPPKNGPR